MKTIVYLTDADEIACTVAKYALATAYKLKANLLLYSSISIDERYPIPDEQTDEYVACKKLKKANIEVGFTILRSQLEVDLQQNYPADGFIPAIDYACWEGSFTESVSVLSYNKDILMMVLANNEHETLYGYVSDADFQQTLDAAKLPLLIVPENNAVGGFDKILFATDGRYNEIDYIQSLTGFAKYFDASIIVSAIGGKNKLTSNQKALKLFMSDLAFKLNFGRASYYELPDNVDAPLEWLIDNEQVDLIAVAHRKGIFADRLLSMGISKEKVSQLNIPMLVYSGDKASVFSTVNL
ncbi:hypothetical protein GCM10023149_00130 [Mucilaginibacter gynuensis]|uniref:Universal stress protein family protein n=1 Tax=Mucilaginibacter gynuensis TaxID=1302236 RepID=A0ABP8FLM8_9SPHI